MASMVLISILAENRIKYNMILSIDHIALSSIDVPADIQLFKRLGYDVVFDLKDLKNVSIKKDLLSRYFEKHHPAVIAMPGNFSIELIDHYSTNLKPSIMVPIFENIPEEMVECMDGNTVENKTFKMARLSEAGIQIRTKNVLDAAGGEGEIHDTGKMASIQGGMNSRFQFNKVIIKTVEIENSLHFWGNLGFKLKAMADNVAVLEFKSLLSKHPYNIYLEKICYDTGKEFAGERPLLDDKGFNCIGVITNSAEREKKVLCGKGINTTEIEECRIQGKRLKIFFATSRAGDIAEVVEVVQMETPSVFSGNNGKNDNRSNRNCFVFIMLLAFAKGFLVNTVLLCQGLVDWF